MMRPPSRWRASARQVHCLMLAALLVASAADLPISAARGNPLRGVEGLARVYDFILDARFDQADAELQRACGPAPPEACDVLAATARWWRILLDPENRSLDPPFTMAVERAIRTAEAWTERAPRDPEAWFYLGGAYAARVQWRVLRDEKLAAARDGKRIHEALETATGLDPSFDDAYFALGMYKYYADVAPAAAQILRFLLLLPGGDKEEGLQEMLRARNKGRLLQGEADYQLHIIYLWYERQTDRALQLLRSLHEEYPGNPLFPIQIAEIQDTYQHDIMGSLATSRALVAAAREQRTNAAPIAEVHGRLGVARQLDRLHQSDQALEQLAAVVALKPGAPYGALALAHLRAGEAHDRLGNRSDAVAAYRAAIAAVPPGDPLKVRGKADDRLRRAPDAKKADAYRLSLEGWRRLEKNDPAAAAAALQRSLALDPSDAVARYRYGRALQAAKLDGAALAEFELAIRGARSAPPPIVGTAYLEAARLHERAGQRDHAIVYYRTASTLFGAGAETRTAATRALARLSGK